MLLLTDLNKSKRAYRHNPWKKATPKQIARVLELKNKSASLAAFYSAMVAHNLWISHLTAVPRKWRLDAVLQEIERKPLLPDDEVANQALMLHLRLHVAALSIPVAPPKKNKTLQLSLFS